MRLARRARELRKLPFGLGDTTSIKGVRKLYERSFFRIRRFPKPQSPELEERFTEMLQDIKNEHSSVQANIARGLQELSEERTDLQRQRGGILLAQGMPFDFGQFLDRFYLSRVGVRVLMGQHIMLHHPQEGFVGVIQKKCQPSVVCQHAIEDAQRICEMQYGYCPEIIVEGSTELTLPYIPEHLHYIFFELLKNSCRAVTERYIDRPNEMPPVHVVFAEVSRRSSTSCLVYELHPCLAANLAAPVADKGLGAIGRGLRVGGVCCRGGRATKTWPSRSRIRAAASRDQAWTVSGPTLSPQQVPLAPTLPPQQIPLALSCIVVTVASACCAGRRRREGGWVRGHQMLMALTVESCGLAAF